MVKLLRVNLPSETLIELTREPISTRISLSVKTNIGLNKTIRNTSSTTNQSIISNQNTLVAKQNETQNHTETKKSKSDRISKGARRDSEPSRLPWKKILNLLNKSIAIQSVRNEITSILFQGQSYLLQNGEKADMKEYKKRRRGNSEFRNKQNRALREKRLENIEKKRGSQRWVSNKCKESNPDHIRELNK
ncbi:hypothetical protein pdam_00022771 [Pocillopora damicornis]|uniref:Uncharacterized protein n=1 Tax=Pocillopora damicornis TaxID=46731 RepID=A0A3M6UP29_POCDA|nr:hypothetical protein pdam_00022771 [Pocillopora damicornis]